MLTIIFSPLIFSLRLNQFQLYPQNLFALRMGTQHVDPSMSEELIRRKQYMVNSENVTYRIVPLILLT